MDSCTHFVFLLAAVLLIVVCTLFLIGAWYTWKHALIIRNDMNIIINDFQSISKSLNELSDEISSLFPHAAEKVSEITENFSKSFPNHQNEHITKLY